MLVSQGLPVPDMAVQRRRHTGVRIRIYSQIVTLPFVGGSRLYMVDIAGCVSPLT